MPEPAAVVAVYDTHDLADAAVRGLQQAGIDVAGISVISGGGVERASAHYTRGGTTLHHGEHRGLWSFLSGLLADTGTFSIPGAGPIMVAGPAVGWLAQAVEDVEGDDAGAVGRALAGSGIPAAYVPRYETAVHDGRWLVIIHGPLETLARAKAIVDATSATETALYQ